MGDANFCDLLPIDVEAEITAQLPAVYADPAALLYPRLRADVPRLALPLRSQPSSMMMRGFLAARYILDGYTAALSLIPQSKWIPNVAVGIADTPRVSFDLIANQLYEDTNRIGNYQFYALSRHCQNFPFPRDCNCNVAARAFYLMGVLGGNLSMGNGVVEKETVVDGSATNVMNVLHAA